VASVSPLALEVTLAVHQELQARIEKSINSASSRFSERAMKPTWLSAATCTWTPYVTSAKMWCRLTIAPGIAFAGGFYAT